MSLVSAIRARILTPINSAGGTPIIVASERFTRRTLSAWSCTTMKSVMASKISIQWRFACSMRVNRRAFSSAIAAWPAMVSRKTRSSGPNGAEFLDRQSSPANSPLAPSSRTSVQSVQPRVRRSFRAQYLFRRARDYGAGMPRHKVAQRRAQRALQAVL